MAKLFQIPTVQEIYDFIIYKQPSWPGSFIEWYAEKFFNHYQASGWRLSSNILMKDWQAAFCSNWKELKWEAKEKLAECQQIEKPIDNINTLFEDFKAGKPNKQGMANAYKGLWAAGLMRFTQEEMNRLVSDAGNDKVRGRYMAVKLYFNKLIKAENDNTRSHDLAGTKTD